MNSTAQPTAPAASKVSVAARRMALSRSAPRTPTRYYDPFGDQSAPPVSRPRDVTPSPRSSRDPRRTETKVTSPTHPTVRTRTTDARDDAGRYDVEVHRKLEKEKWVQLHEPKPLVGNEFRIALRMLITEAAGYHARNGSNALNCRIAGALLAKNRGGLPTDLPVDVHSCQVSSRVVRQLFTDVDNICEHYQDGPRLALQALQEMSLWRR